MNGHDVLWLKISRKDETKSDYTLVLPNGYFLFFVIPSPVSTCPYYIQFIWTKIGMISNGFVKNTYAF